MEITGEIILIALTQGLSSLLRLGGENKKALTCSFYPAHAVDIKAWSCQEGLRFLGWFVRRRCLQGLTVSSVTPADDISVLIRRRELQEKKKNG